MGGDTIQQLVKVESSRVRELQLFTPAMNRVLSTL